MNDYRDIVTSGELFDIVFVPEHKSSMIGTSIQLKIKDIRKST